ncbi:hypothetical protein NUW58_g3967 [Xylaria curta]|uniref:Uncharacterized protein n=1 Tax=Xylaria curta TaxID=42375 RepID=A0ACC1P8L3_9PEZI|nr:hypothetical protein NUW58_g3967 [Xylaria curta]
MSSHPKIDDDFNYNLFQQIYCLSMASNIVGKTEGTEANLQAAMKQALNQKLPILTGSWALSWGPRVYQEQDPDSPKGGPDNAWFAAVDDTQKICVVAIAGTASNSDVDLHQDIDVKDVVNFNAWVDQWSAQGIAKPTVSVPDPNTSSQLPYCSKGTCAGVYNILSNVSTESGEGTRIDQYLRDLDSSYTVVFTGHSLGGALAPVSALGLVKKNLIGNKNVKIVPSAGVSPGNDKFAADYAAALPKDTQPGPGYSVYNVDYYNVFDVVPQAWSISPSDDRNLNNILTEILHCSDSLKPTAEFFWGLAFDDSKNSNIRYTPLPGESFTAQPPPTLIDTWGELLNVVSYEHVIAYWEELGITEFMNQFNDKFRRGLRRRGPSAV